MDQFAFDQPEGSGADQRSMLFTASAKPPLEAMASLAALDRSA